MFANGTAGAAWPSSGTGVPDGSDVDAPLSPSANDFSTLYFLPSRTISISLTPITAADSTRPKHISQLTLYTKEKPPDRSRANLFHHLHNPSEAR